MILFEKDFGSPEKDLLQGSLQRRVRKTCRYGFRLWCLDRRPASAELPPTCRTHLEASWREKKKMVFNSKRLFLTLKWLASSLKTK